MFGLMTKKQLEKRLKDYWDSLYSLDRSYAFRRNYLQERWEREIKGELNSLRLTINRMRPEVYTDINALKKHFQSELNGIHNAIMSIDRDISQLQEDQRRARAKKPDPGPICFECEHGKWKVRRCIEHMWNDYDCTHPVHYKKDIDPSGDGCKDFKEEVIT